MTINLRQNELINSTTLIITFIIMIVIITFYKLLNDYKNELEHHKNINKILINFIENTQNNQKSAVKFYNDYKKYKSCPKEFIIRYQIKN
jgi:hypothetical protein